LLFVHFCRAFKSSRIQRETQAAAQGYSPRKIFAAALIVCPMSADVCDMEMKPASNCDGAK
jgi:hypothetical protein